MMTDIVTKLDKHLAINAFLDLVGFDEDMLTRGIMMTDCEMSIKDGYLTFKTEWQWAITPDILNTAIHRLEKRARKAREKG